MIIERLSASDWARFKAIRLASLQDSPDAFGSVYSEVYARPESAWISQVNDLPTFVGTIGGKDSGIVRVAFDDDDRKSCWLLSMWVAPWARGKGLGDLLIRSIVKWAADNDIGKILLDVGDKNLPAQKLYTRNGFRPNGITGCLPSPRQHIKEQQMELLLTGE